MDVRSVERAIDILRCVGESPSPPTVSEMQKRTGLSRPTLYRILATLEKKDMLRSFGEPLQYDLSHGSLALGANWLSKVDIAAIGGPIVKELSSAVNETTAAFVPTSERARMCVIASISNQTLTFSQSVGEVRPLAMGAAGKAILAFMPDAKVAAAIGASKPDGSRAQLLADLKSARQNGGLIVFGEVIEHGFGVAAPVFDHSGEVAGSIAVLGPRSRADDAILDRHLKKTIAAGRRLSEMLGYRAPASIHRIARRVAR